MFSLHLLLVTRQIVLKIEISQIGQLPLLGLGSGVVDLGFNC